MVEWESFEPYRLFIFRKFKLETMFGDNKSANKNTTGDSHAANVIQKGTVIKGEIESAGNIRIDGTLVGTLTTKAKLVVGSTGDILGDVFCQNANLEGKVEGRVEVVGQLYLKSTALIDGDIVTKKLVVEEGAQFNGSCQMGAKVQKANLSSNGKEAIQKQAV